MRGTLAIVTCAVVLAVPAVASAQSCPDGWFCEQDETGESSATDSDDEAGDAAEQPTADEAKSKKDKSGTVVVYRPENDGKDRKIIIVDRAENAPAPPKKRKRREWGFNLRLEGVLMGNDDKANRDAGMGGLGFSLRYRPIPYFAFDAGVDFVGGVDWAGNERNESALLLSGIAFFNPRSKAQFYAIGGIGFSGAQVLREQPAYENPDGSIVEGEVFEERYSYFGAHLGIGLEFRVSKKVALNVDVLGFIRGRTDRLAREQPEFVDPDTGRVTNTSGGGLFRGGITFYW